MLRSDKGPLPTFLEPPRGPPSARLTTVVWAARDYAEYTQGKMSSDELATHIIKCGLPSIDLGGPGGNLMSQGVSSSSALPPPVLGPSSSSPPVFAPHPPPSLLEATARPLRVLPTKTQVVPNCASCGAYNRCDTGPLHIFTGSLGSRRRRSLPRAGSSA